MIHNPAGLYSGGAFKVDTTSALNYFLKKQAQEEATKKTLEKHFTTLTDNASPTGMRTNLEGEAYQQAIQNYSDYWNSNKNKILNGDIKATSEAEKLAKIPFNIVAASKEALNTSKLTGQISATNPDAYARWTEETVGIDKATGKPKLDEFGNPMGIIAHDQPIYVVDPSTKAVVANPKFKAFDLSAIAVNPKELNGKEMQDYIDNYTADIKPSESSLGVQPDPKRKGYEYEVTEIGYDAPSLKTIGDKALQLYDNREVKYTFEKNHPFKEWTEQNVDMFTKANDKFKAIYGKDIENNKELFAGLTILNKDTKQQKVSPSRENPDIKRQKDMADSMKLERFKKSLNPTQVASVMDADTDLDRVSDDTYTTSAGKKVIKKGKGWFNPDGTPYTSAPGAFDIRITKDKIPVTIIDKRPSGVNPLLIDDMDFRIENGIAQGVRNPDVGLISRTDFIKDIAKTAGIKTPINQTNSVPSSSTPKPKKGSLNNLIKKP